ncbi:MAG: hypothetical protein JWN67_373 [Actinomycetia bacterium]|nr:hypothetical protein [Actinomycetes bacterium]
MDGPVVDIEELRAALLLLLDEAEREFGSSVDLAGDIYWELDPDIARSGDAPPTATLAGSLVEDVEEMQAMLGRDDGEVFLWHDLVHSVGVLARIADLARPSSAQFGERARRGRRRGP